jgi:hypothetical protein
VRVAYHPAVARFLNDLPAVDTHSPAVMLATPASPSAPTPMVLARPLELARADPRETGVLRGEGPSLQARRRATHRAYVSCLEQLVENKRVYR